MAFSAQDILEEFAEAQGLHNNWKADNDLLLYQQRLWALERHRRNYKAWIANPINKARKKAYTKANWRRWLETRAAAKKRWQARIYADPKRLEAFRERRKKSDQKYQEKRKEAVAAFRSTPEYLAKNNARRRRKRAAELEANGRTNNAERLKQWRLNNPEKYEAAKARQREKRKKS